MTAAATKRKLAAVRSATCRFQETRQGDFQNQFEKSAFEFTHNLSASEFFTIDAILDLAKSQPECTYYDAGQIRVDQRWDEIPERKLSMEETIRHIDNAGAWLFINKAERNPEYARILDECLSQAEELAKQKFRDGMRNQEMIIFLTSPGRITPYHIDRECNFLLQVQGRKAVHTFDGRDRSILSEEELERFWSIDNNAARYEACNQDKARIFSLEPGGGIHIPVNHPHWVQNGAEVSVSVSINFQFADQARANTYRVNHFLRKRGLAPTPPGQSAWRDGLKLAAYSCARAISHAVKK